MYKPLLRLATTYPRSVVVAALCITACAIAAIPRIGLRLDGRSLIPAGEESLMPSDSAGALFALKDIVVLAVVAPNGDMLSREGVERIGRISSDLQRLGGMEEHTVTSITTLPLIGRRGGVVEPDEPVGTAPVDDARLARIREKVAALGLRNGIFLSTDGHAAAVYGFARTEADREALLDGVEAIAQRYRTSGFDIHIGGNALAQPELGRSVARDLFVLVPFLVAALMILMTVVFRTINAAFVSLAEIGLSLIWTTGAIGIVGGHVFITTLVLPVVLIAIGVTDDIYALNRYIAGRRKAGDMPHSRIVSEAFMEVGRPVSMTALTSMAGLVSLAFTNLEPLRIFGLFGALSIGLSTICTFTIVPAMLVLVPPKLRAGSTRSNRRLSKIAGRLLRGIERVGPRRLVFLAVPIAAAAVLVATHLRIDDSWIGNIAPSSDVAKGDRVINQFLAGSTTVEIAIAAPGRDGFLDAGTFRLLARVEEEVLKVQGVGAVQSTYSDVLRITATLAGLPYNEFRQRVAQGTEHVSSADISNAIAIDASLGRPTLGRYLSDDAHHARITVFVHGADYERLRPVFQRVNEVLAEPPRQAIGTPFGDGWISYLTVKLLVEGQIVSIAFASLADLLLVALLLRSIRGALVAVLPIMVSVLITFAILVLLGSPLGIASSMFASIALGIGVDYSIHLTSEIQHACVGAPSLRIALRRAFSQTGPSIIISAATITVGFGVLLVSSVVPNRMLGLLVCISLSVCAMMTLLLVPGLSGILGLWRASRRKIARAAAPAAMPGLSLNGVVAGSESVSKN
ncbi:MAG: MMPL family transporter [Bacteroidetes bacterium]|nr:MMPL family transporter [Bacteroidota bacterium]